MSIREFLKPAISRWTRLRHAERDALAIAVAVAAIIMFVGTGGQVLSLITASASGLGFGPGRLLTSALLLNIALVIFGWRRYVQLNREMQQRGIAEAQARTLAETDALTGCLNRRGFSPLAEGLLATARMRGEASAVMVIDLDHFKSINDLNGHSIGDAVIRQSAERIRLCLPEGAVLARLGGDEFACCIAFDPARTDHASAIADDIIARVCRPMDVPGFDGSVTVSLGIVHSDMLRIIPPGSEHHDEAGDISRLLHMADIAMYHAKRSGRDRLRWFEPAMEEELRQRRAIEAAIRKGLAAGEFVPYYEQQINVATGQVCGFEMLARWRTENGIIAPNIFIPIAEEMGVIGEMSEQLITQALRDARQWAPELTLSVNISPVQLRDPWFAQRLLKLLVSEGFPPARLDIEITESCLHDNLAGVQTQIASLKNQGIAVSLDDFGTGYSSLAQLRALPFNRIKIDRTFVTNMHDNTENATIVRTISALGAGLGLPITAEGIETEIVSAHLNELGDFTGQGYFYGHPQPAEVVNADLARLGLLVEAKSAPPVAPADDDTGEAPRAQNSA